MLRRLPPVHSPLSADAVAAGVAAARSPGAAATARARIERWLRATFSPRAALLLDSGTSALTLALSLALRRRQTRRVALPAWGCYDLATACDGAGVDVLLYDLDPARLTPDWDSLRRALEAGSEAVVMVHYFGLPVPLPEMRALADQHGATIIEDAAQGTGGTFEGRPCGSLGDLSVLSFGRGKGITGGRGGALLAHTQAWAELLEAEQAALDAAPPGWSDLPKAAAQYLLARPGWYALPAAIPFLRLGETIYHPPRAPGPMPRSALGILSRTITLAEAEAGRRRVNAGRLAAASDASPRFRRVLPADRAVAGYLRFPVVARGRPADLSADPAPGLGIMPGYPRILAELPGFRDRIRNSGEWPGARELATSLATCPTHGLLSSHDVERLAEWLRAAA